ncbi:MAG: GNAT family N-acetyltransferase [Gammaproteobacteria bacterium HGW-Gammaproteobacteria-4]|jgi:ribosomal protein S18 acetylase RimI-like enzyme|nr:MAG: GNAT family N-acetyltransferase [Gammaproteobacteria bacterium HGW-Gammaproteobacteria-4]
MTDILIRPAHRDDIDLLAQWACAMAMETEHKRLDPGTVQRGIATAMAQPQRGRYWLAERSGEPAGTLMVTYEWSDWRAADWWWIQSVYVAPAHRRRGVYAALYRQVHDEAARTPAVCGLRLYVEKENTAAQRTYHTLGMHDAGYHMYEAALTRAGNG